MPAIITDKGKAVPSFYGISGGIANGVQQTNWLLYAILVIAGVAIVFFLRRSNSSSSAITGTGPALTLNPGYGADIANLMNMTQTVNAIAGQRGGVSTPITPSPSPANTPAIR